MPSGAVAPDLGGQQAEAADTGIGVTAQGDRLGGIEAMRAARVGATGRGRPPCAGRY
jgi:hypothetical protein